MVQRSDAREKVTGRAIYADDLHLSETCFAIPLFAEHPSAIIKRINTDRALATPGVIDVIIAADIPGSIRVGGLVRDHYVLAEDRTRYHGDVVAMIAAETVEIARRAAELIIVDYEPLVPLLSPKEAMADGAPAIHEKTPDNIISSFKIRHGNALKLLDESDEVIEAEFRTQFIEHAYLEPESCVAVPESDGSITVHGGMQHPFSTRRFVSAATGLPLSKSRIVQTTLGGGFGGRDDTIAIICARAAVLALRIGRPVKITYTREESIRESYKRHPFDIRYKASLDKRGKIEAMAVDMTADAGPCCSVSPFVIWRPTVQCTGPYIVKNVHCDSRAVYTNNTFTGAMRGFGTPQQVFACESFIDICAERAGMDPYEFRKLNFFKQNTVTHTGQKLAGHKVSLNEVTEKALKKIAWKKNFKKCSKGKPREDGLLYGIGFATSYRGVSLGAEGNDFCSAIVNIQPDGSVLLEVGVSENGQGLKTVMIHILAKELGIPDNQIRFIDTDTSSIPDGGPTVASRGTIVGGNAVIDAANRIKAQMQPVLKELIGASRKGYEFKKGRIRNPLNKKSIKFQDVVAECHDRSMYLHQLGIFKGPKVFWEEKNGRGNAYFTYVYGCQACSLTIDPKGGRVKVGEVVAAHEVGHAINPQMAIGQIFGGVVMGLGFALSEEIKHQHGIIQTDNYNTYRIPRSTDAPQMTAILVENPDPAGPWGAKSLGEPVNELMGAAVANAIYYATGCRITESPITPEKIISAISKGSE